MNREEIKGVTREAVEGRKRSHDPERKKFYAGTERITMKSIQCCKCWHIGRKLECRKCGHHICLSCKEPS